MIIFEDKHVCECKNVFSWKYIKLDNGEWWTGKIDDKIKNCVDFAEAPNLYSFVIKCPRCEKRYVVTKRKS